MRAQERPSDTKKRYAEAQSEPLRSAALDRFLYFPTANGKDSSEVGKMRICEGMKKPRAGELQGA